MSIDLSKITSFNTKKLVLFTIPDCNFPIVKGQHRYRAYYLAMEKLFHNNTVGLVRMLTFNNGKFSIRNSEKN